jgi:signal transduction histidine kinase
MAPNAPRPIAVVSSATDVFDASLRRVVPELTNLESLDGHADLQGCVARVAEELRKRIVDPRLGPAPPELADDPLFDRCLDALSDDLIRSASDPETASATIRVLEAILRLRSREPDEDRAVYESEDLRTRLRAADAFDLVIEVAHDFRSPLTSILFLAETLRDGHSGDVNDLQRSQLGLMYSAAFGLASVASDVMDLARRVLLNLTTNALKFTEDGHVELGVKAVERSRLLYYVQDTGRGIPAERQPELFRPFKKRLGQAQGGHFFSGSGVGLSIARRLVTAMGSELVLETSDETGTRFSFTVPASPRRSPEAPAL